MEALLKVAAAIAAGLSFGGILASWLIKREITRIMAAVDRIPTAEWFDEIKARLDKVPSGEWFQDVKRQLDNLSRIAAAVDNHAGRLDRAEGRLDAGQGRFQKLDERLDNHHTRIAVLEERSKSKKEGE